ncbi:hypothetical protein [Herbidospora mongoliensis]|uniref:hypothetical protein n=1 Tax=Herbidospora mongoliensis TaxID=688067 RepID=UPI000833924F|nr:hypothetical protein [Herbidospora mongoliensis]
MPYDGEDDEYYDHSEPAPDAIAGVTAEVRITVPPLDLGTAVGNRTLADLVVDTCLDRLSKTVEWPGLKGRIKEIRNEQIQAAVKAEIITALSEPFQITNSYGQPTGEPTTLRAVIAEMAGKALDRQPDRYSSNTKTLREILTEEVNKAFKAELVQVIEAEKARIVAQMREKAAALIAEAALAAGLEARTNAPSGT